MTTAIEEAEKRTKEKLQLIEAGREQLIGDTDIDPSVLPYISRHVGKVRDVYVCEDFVVMVTTDRQSAFDRNLASVSYSIPPLFDTPN